MQKVRSRISGIFTLFPLFILLSLTCALSARGTVELVPEPQQPALARKILDGYCGQRQKLVPPKLHVLYFTPSDRDPEPRYRERLSAIMEDIQAFYRDGMTRAGFGPETFELDRDAAGQMNLHLVKGKEPEADFRRSSGPDERRRLQRSADTITRESQAVLKAEGIDLDRETVLIFCNLAKWDAAANTFTNQSPYWGSGDQRHGLCFVMDSVILDAADLAKKEPILHDMWGDESLGKFNTVFIGGVAHELGHAFTLPHCGERPDQRLLGVSLMGIGNHYYRNELRGEKPSAFLAMASAMKLAGQPLFNHAIVNSSLPGKIVQSEMHLSTNVTRADLIGHPHALRLEGVVQGTPPIYGVIAYFDSVLDGGYQAPAATSVPDAEGRFAIEISDLRRATKGEIRVQYCHANGAVSERKLSLQLLAVAAKASASKEVKTTVQP